MTNNDLKINLSFNLVVVDYSCRLRNRIIHNCKNL
jgi:hypothetical protein